jgi:hypothetical protein
MSGTQDDQLGLLGNALASYLGPTSTSPDDPSVRFGSAYEVPKYSPPGTYTGAVPTPPADTASTALALPHDYYSAVDMLKQSGGYTQQLDRALQALYLGRHSRT